METRAAIGTAETPAEPINGLIGVLDNRFINLAINTPVAVPTQKAAIPRNKIPSVSQFRNFFALIFEPTPRPKKIVTTLISAF